MESVATEKLVVHMWVARQTVARGLRGWKELGDARHGWVRKRKRCWGGKEWAGNVVLENIRPSVDSRSCLMLTRSRAGQMMGPLRLADRNHNCTAASSLGKMRE